jgi:hypothetical protein
MGRSGESTSFTLRFENAEIYNYSIYYIHSIKEILHDGTTAKLNENIIYYWSHFCRFNIFYFPDRKLS